LTKPHRLFESVHFLIAATKATEDSVRDPRVRDGKHPFVAGRKYRRKRNLSKIRVEEAEKLASAQPLADLSCPLRSQGRVTIPDEWILSLNHHFPSLTKSFCTPGYEAVLIGYMGENITRHDEVNVGQIDLKNVPHVKSAVRIPSSGFLDRNRRQINSGCRSDSGKSIGEPAAATPQF